MFALLESSQCNSSRNLPNDEWIGSISAPSHIHAVQSGETRSRDTLPQSPGRARKGSRGRQWDSACASIIPQAESHCLLLTHLSLFLGSDLGDRGVSPGLARLHGVSIGGG